MTGDTDQRPTSALSAMINQRSSASLPCDGPNGSPVYRPADLSPCDADPTRRRNLTVEGTCTTNLPAPPSSGGLKRSSAWNTKKRILVPESSSPEKGGEGGFVRPGDEASHLSNRRVKNGTVSPYFTDGQGRLEVPVPQLPASLRPGLLSSRPITPVIQSSQNPRDDSPRPLKRLLRPGDVPSSQASSVGGSPDGEDKTSDDASLNAASNQVSNEGPSVNRRLDALHMVSTNTSREASVMPIDVMTLVGDPTQDKVGNSDDEQALSPQVAMLPKRSTAKRIIPDSPDTVRGSPLARQPLVSPTKGTANMSTEAMFGRWKELYKRIPEPELRRIWKESGSDIAKASDLAQKLGASKPSHPAKPGTKPPPPQSPISPVPMAPLASVQPTAKANVGPAPALRKLKRKAESDQESDGSSDYDSDSEEEPVISQEQALEFFNTCDVAEMPGITACTLDQAKAIVNLRPFADPEDMRKKLRKQKGVSSAIFEQYRDIMRGYIEVDRVLGKCEKHGEELSRVMRIWTGVSNAPDTTFETISGNAPIIVPDGSVHLVELSETAVTEGTKDDASAEVKEAFKGYIRQQPEAIPDPIKLKPYQMLGINWLTLLHSRGTSCILADEMGLGKTAQVIAFLAHLKSIKATGPHLVIVPASTLDNWIREFSVFAPSLSVQAYYGSQAERAELRHEIRNMDPLDVVVTTYNIATSSIEDRKFLEKMRFKTGTYDEGHQLKNSESKKYKDLMRVPIPWRLLLTGTPLQNNLQELVSLLSFILPNIFNQAREDLRAIFKVPADAQANLLSLQRITRAKKMMTPFVLRRKKVQVLRDLPQKIERIEFCPMTMLQRTVYREAMQRSRKALADPNALEEAMLDDDEEKPKKGKKKGPATKTGKASNESSSSNVLMELRKASNHPMLFRRIYDDKKIKAMAKDCLRELEFHDRNVDYIYEDMEVMNDFELQNFVRPYKHLQKYALKKSEWMEAGKISVLKKLLPEMKARGDRVLLFSQFTQILAILELVLETMGIRYIILTGSTAVNERQALVDQFTNDTDITVFLLSTRAGGLGLNLMAANTVIIHDQDFNPHNDRQAEDRAYRLGQKKDVTVIRLITKGTIEEDILQLAQTKIALDVSVSADSTQATGASPSAVVSGSEGNEAQTEKAIKVSLMAKLKKRFDEEGATGQVEAEEAPPEEGVDVDMAEAAAAVEPNTR